MCRSKPDALDSSIFLMEAQIALGKIWVYVSGCGGDVWRCKVVVPLEVPESY